MSESERIVGSSGPEVRPDFGPAVVPEPSNPDVAHEHSDVNVRGILGLGLGLAIVGAVVHVVVWGVFTGLGDRDERENPVTFPLAAEDNGRPLGERVDGIPAPRLEGLYQRDKPSDRPDVRPVLLDPSRDPKLTGYEWVEKGRVARIPIDAAMREVLRGKEFQSPRPAEKGIGDRRTGLEVPSQSNSGRGAPREER
jgi:hypothetical protein